MVNLDHTSTGDDLLPRPMKRMLNYRNPYHNQTWFRVDRQAFTDKDHNNLGSYFIHIYNLRG